MTADTQTPVEELEGRELDACVAEEVMGWRPVEEGEVPEGRLDGTPTDVGLEDAWWKGGQPDARMHVGLPRFSSDIGAAWEVLEEIEQRTIEELGRFLGRADTGRPWYRLSSEEMAERICRAALRAVRDD